MRQEIEETYRALGRIDYETSGRLGVLPIYGEAVDLYLEGFKEAQKKPRPVYYSRAQIFAMQRGRKNNPRLTPTGRERKTKNADW